MIKCKKKGDFFWSSTAIASNVLFLEVTNPSSLLHWIKDIWFSLKQSSFPVLDWTVFQGDLHLDFDGAPA